VRGVVIVTGSVRSICDGGPLAWVELIIFEPLAKAVEDLGCRDQLERNFRAHCLVKPHPFLSPSELTRRQRQRSASLGFKIVKHDSLGRCTLLASRSVSAAPQAAA
jgi:hypothetical protein